MPMAPLLGIVGLSWDWFEPFMQKNLLSFGADVPVERLRAFIREGGYQPNQRLPPERDLALRLGLPRNRLRETLAMLERAGEVWRHVGRGTFVGAPRDEFDLSDATAIARLTNPFEVIEARLLLEPRLAAIAATRATEADLARMEDCVRKGRLSSDGITSQKCGDLLHRAVAQATRNNLLLSLFEMIYAVREATTWGRLKPALLTITRLEKQWNEHGAIVRAIRERDSVAAARVMRQHIDDVRLELTRIAEGEDGQ